ncbi:hypothetical protein UCDDS831_g06160 [Diplodia seriata]|uniref:Uncharacterized protein n=1 Tax=Diplodia seriata TaxID=420778 RepID=A0A0G2E4I7_9PEZI|nr:hypothetical protein UCDDS831_g06160 [Diplodia seriata]
MASGFWATSTTIWWENGGFASHELGPAAAPPFREMDCPGMITSDHEDDDDDDDDDEAPAPAPEVPAETIWMPAEGKAAAKARRKAASCCCCCCYR